LDEKLDELKKAFEKKPEKKGEKLEKSTAAKKETTAAPKEDVSEGAKFAEELLAEDSDGLEAWYSAWDHTQVGGECAHLEDFVADMEQSSNAFAIESKKCTTSACYEHFANEINEITQKIEEKSHFCHEDGF
jgi:hypothetical protein